MITRQIGKKGDCPPGKRGLSPFLFWSSPDESGRYNCETSFATPKDFGVAELALRLGVPELRCATTASAKAEEKFDFSDYLWYIWMRKNLKVHSRFL